jgi:hypothetical protein
MSSDEVFLNDPDKKQTNGLYCFLDCDRECGADCMAYASPPQGNDYNGRQWAQCKLVVAAHQTAKHLTVLAQIVKDDSDDRKRTGQPAPQAPR